MHVVNMTKKDFDDMPWSEPPTRKRFSFLVIIPTGELHDSGYGCMTFVAVDKNGEPICKFGGNSDVVHINGMLGIGEWRGEIPKEIKPESWSIDMLPCGYIRLFPRSDMYFTAPYIVSDFEIYSDNA